MKNKIGISLRYFKNPALFSRKILRELDFKNIEFSGDLLESDNLSNSISGNNHELYAAELMPSALTRSISTQDKGIIKEFHRKFSKLADLLVNNSISTLTMDFAIDPSDEDKNNQQKIKLLKQLASIINGKNLSLCLPIRIPSPASNTTEFMLTELRNIMHPQIHLAVNIHPHELPRDFSPSELFRWLKFEAELVRFIYEPETGNKLVRAPLLPWMDYFQQINFKGAILFCPRITDDLELLEAEMFDLLKLSENLMTKSD